MSGPQPIETRYAGCRFRSRTEARWAVWLDAMGWDWQFEPEGFSLPSGRYLPDFRVTPTSGVNVDTFWLEIKPYIPPPHDDSRWADLARATDMRVLVAYGMHRTGDGCKKAWLRKEVAAHCGRIVLPSGGSKMLGPFWTEDANRHAWDKASSARFEFGESG